MDPLDFIIEAQELGLLTTWRPEPQLAKGQCPYCLRHVGKGLHKHKLACKERKN